MELTIGDLAIIIRLVEKELNELYKEIESENEDISNDASDLSVKVGETAGKLKLLYESQHSEDSNYPTYEELTKQI